MFPPAPDDRDLPQGWDQERPLGQPAPKQSGVPAGTNPSSASLNRPNSYDDLERAIANDGFERGAGVPTQDVGLPTSEIRARRVADSNAAQKTSARLLWLFALLALFVLVRFNLAPIVEEVRYALSRGEQRAESDHARTQLQMNLTDASEAFRLVYKAVGPSVVHIDVRSRLVQNRRGPFGPQVTAGQGSGVILDKEGYILTNNHVIEGAQQIDVRLSDGRTITNAQVIGTDEHTDLAVLKISADGLIASPWGDSESMQVGDWVVAVGNPFGLDRSVTAGIISATRRDRVVHNMTYQSFLQTDAAVNPGNSGGPLVNLDGEVIGITTAIVGEAYQGVSLAIPSEIARDIYQRLKDNGVVERGWLGVRLQPLSPEEAAARNIPARGALIVEVVDNPAVRAGLKVGDVITKWNDLEVKDDQDLMMKVAQTRVSTVASLEVLRDSETPIKIQVAVGERLDFN